MEKRSLPLYYGGGLMPWAKATVVKGAKGFVWLAGTEGRDPNDPTLEKVVDGIEAQARMCMEKIKSWLEECGSSLENIIKLTYYIKGPDFPDGVHNYPDFQKAFKVIDDFFRENCPDLCIDRNPPTSDLIGVAGLGHKNMLIEIACVAAIPDD